MRNLELPMLPSSRFFFMLAVESSLEGTGVACSMKRGSRAIERVKLLHKIDI